MKQQDSIFVAGHRGLVGSAIVRRLERDAFTNLITRTRAELDLTNQNDVRRFFETERPAYVFLAAAKVGGILANNRYGADFIRENLQIQTNIIDAAYRNGTAKLLFLGLVLYISEARAAADEGGTPAHRSSRTDE